MYVEHIHALKHIHIVNKQIFYKTPNFHYYYHIIIITFRFNLLEETSYINCLYILFLKIFLLLYLCVYVCRCVRCKSPQPLSYLETRSLNLELTDLACQAPEESACHWESWDHRHMPSCWLFTEVLGCSLWMFMLVDQARSNEATYLAPKDYIFQQLL